jgi:3-oxoacid CoA-transferase
MDGNLEVELVPQGTLAEKLRAAGAGIPAFYTPTGVGNVVEEGNFPIKLKPGTGEPEILTEPKVTREFNGKKYIMEESLFTDFSLIKGWRGDDEGNIIFNKTARNFNTEISKAGGLTIAEIEEVVPLGAIDPSSGEHNHIFRI